MTKIIVNSYPFNYREKMRLILVSDLFGLTAQFVMKENVKRLKRLTQLEQNGWLLLWRNYFLLKDSRIRHNILPL